MAPALGSSPNSSSKPSGCDVTLLRQFFARARELPSIQVSELTQIQPATPRELLKEAYPGLPGLYGLLKEYLCARAEILRPRRGRCGSFSGFRRRPARSEGR